MKDGFARGIAIVALVFMGIFVGSLIATLADSTLLYGNIGYLALGAGVFTLMLFIALKADGKGFSLSRMKIDEEMEEIYKKLDEQNAESKEQGDEIINDENAERENAADAEQNPPENPEQNQ